MNGVPASGSRAAPHTLTYLGRDLGFRERTVLIHGNVLLWLRDGSRCGSREG